MPDYQTDLSWRTIAEFTLPATADRAHHAVQQVVTAMEDFNLTTARLEQLTKALSDAVHNGLAQGYRLRMDLPLHIKVAVFTPADQPAACCWGFFLVIRTADQLYEADGLARHMIEVFLYQENASPREAAA